MTTTNIPYSPTIDLVPEMTNNTDGYAPDDQNGYNGCQFWSFAFAAEGEHRRAGQPIHINRRAGYYMAKQVGHSGGWGNNGATVENVSTALRVFGVPTHPTWSDYGDYDLKPPQEVYDNAALYNGVSVDYMRYITSGPATDDYLQSLFSLIQRGKFLPAKFRMTADFDNSAGVASDWRASDWDGSYATGGTGRGDHVVTICGYDLAARRFLAANHWGEHWGDGGFFGVPFDKVLPGAQRCFDMFYIVNGLSVPSVGVPMSNPIPTSLTPDQLAAFETAVRKKLQDAFNLNSWPGALGTAVLMGLSDKQFEMYAPVLGGLPRFTVRTQVDAGAFDWPTGMREELGA